MGLIFNAFEAIPTREKDLFAMAHYEEYKDMKTLEIAEEVKRRIEEVMKENER